MDVILSARNLLYVLIFSFTVLVCNTNFSYYINDLMNEYCSITADTIAFYNYFANHIIALDEYFNRRP